MQSPSPRPTKPQIAVAADLNSRYNPPQPAAASPLSFRLIFQLEKRHASGESFQDWSAGYRLFSQQRVEPQRLLDASRREVLARLPPEAPLLVAIDDTLLAKSSLKTPGVSWRRAPLAVIYASG